MCTGEALAPSYDRAQANVVEDIENTLLVQSRDHLFSIVNSENRTVQIQKAFHLIQLEPHMIQSKWQLVKTYNPQTNLSVSDAPVHRNHFLFFPLPSPRPLSPFPILLLNSTGVSGLCASDRASVSCSWCAFQRILTHHVTVAHRLLPFSAITGHQPFFLIDRRMEA